MPQKPIRLPPLEVLRVKNPKRNPKNPCTVVMSSVLGYNAAGCAAIETQLRQCMDGPKPQPASPNTINHHMGRLGKHITYDGKPTRAREIETQCDKKHEAAESASSVDVTNTNQEEEKAKDRDLLHARAAQD
ncbi:37S ribosomal protein Mrp10 [Akanthomyces lecanii RCEF 1005]|uniref:37S ribosomal protein Mrp10 n=1 Tax=Akanthomyces lecanii RCEF 1005 TaxID=1081108 RepID=A0A168C971_CORDF|nr:37S ribosomal protein Mrp10 [Akanthomyces lecanii RCEF 1005]